MMFSPPSSTDYDGHLSSKTPLAGSDARDGHGGHGLGPSSTPFTNFSFTGHSNASASSAESGARRKAAAAAAAATSQVGSRNINVPSSSSASSGTAIHPTHSSNLGIHSPISLDSAATNDSQDTDNDGALFLKQNGNPSAAAGTGGPGSAAAAAASAGNRKSSLDNDQFSLASSISRTSCGSRADDSLIFERLVQDPLTDAQPIPHSLPRHISSETFIPASLDTTTHMILNRDDAIDDLGEEDPANPGSAVQFGFNSRRSSLANLEAALGGHSSAASSRRPSIVNLQSSFGMNSSYRLNSSSTNTLSRSQTNSSFSNLTQQFQNSNSNKRIPQSQPLSQSLSQNSQQSATQNTSPSNVSNLPPLTTTLTSSSVTSLSNQRNPSSSPLMKNKSFCSYADIIAQDDHDSKYPIRRPSISLSLSNQKLARTNSISSASQLCGCNSPRSPSNCAPSFANNFRSNSTVSNILSPPNNTNNNNNANSISTSLSNKNIRGSPSVKSDSNYIPLPSFALESDNRDYPINSVNNNNTPRRSGFSGRPINTGGYTMRVSNSNSSYNSNNNTSTNLTSPSQNANGLLNLKKKELPSHPQRSLQSELISDDESIKSFKTANLPAE